MYMAPLFNLMHFDFCFSQVNGHGGPYAEVFRPCFSCINIAFLVRIKPRSYGGFFPTVVALDIRLQFIIGSQLFFSKKVVFLTIMVVPSAIRCIKCLYTDNIPARSMGRIIGYPASFEECEIKIYITYNSFSIAASTSFNSSQNTFPSASNTSAFSALAASSILKALSESFIAPIVLEEPFMACAITAYTL